MNSWKVILAAAVIFGAGILTGGVIINFVEHSHSAPNQISSADSNSRPGERDPRGQDLPRPHSPEMMSRQFLKQLDTSLQLTAEQHDAIEKILAEGQEKNRRLWTNIAPDVRRVMQEVRQNIRAQLTPEQLKQFEAMMKRPPRKSQSTNAAPASVSETNMPSSK